MHVTFYRNDKYILTQRQISFNIFHVYVFEVCFDFVIHFFIIITLIVFYDLINTFTRGQYVYNNNHIKSETKFIYTASQ
jgi:hypothetical protein